MDHLEIARGSTYDFTLTLSEDYDLSEATQIWITFKQSKYGKEVLTLTLNDVIVEDNVISAHLTQEQTLLFLSTNEALMQVRILMTDDALVQIPPTNVIVFDVLKDGVIS